MTNRDFDSRFGSDPHYRGTFYKDRLPRRKLRLNEYIVINLDDSTSGRGGTHWIGLYMGDKPEVFDSMGAPPPDTVLRWLGRSALYNDGRIQDMRSWACGPYVAHVLDKRRNGNSLAGALRVFSDSPSVNNRLVLASG